MQDSLGLRPRLTQRVKVLNLKRQPSTQTGCTWSCRVKSLNFLVTKTSLVVGPWRHLGHQEQKRLQTGGQGAVTDANPPKKICPTPAIQLLVRKTLAGLSRGISKMLPGRSPGKAFQVTPCGSKSQHNEDSSFPSRELFIWFGPSTPCLTTWTLWDRLHFTSPGLLLRNASYMWNCKECCRSSPSRASRLSEEAEACCKHFNNETFIRPDILAVSALV